MWDIKYNTRYYTALYLHDRSYSEQGILNVRTRYTADKFLWINLTIAKAPLWFKVVAFLIARLFCKRNWIENKVYGYGNQNI